MLQEDKDDPQTECQVFVENWCDSAFLARAGAGVGLNAAGVPASSTGLAAGILEGASLGLGQDSASALKREFINTIGFTYVNDVLNLGDPFNFSIANPDGRYNAQFQRGATVRFYLKNPNVNGGRLTLKHEGIVTNRTLRFDRSGCYLDIVCCDKGWHLRENDAPLWYVLQDSTLQGLLSDRDFIDPSWGLKGIRTDNETGRLIRRGLNQSRAQIAIDLQTLGTTTYIQVEPGDKVSDIITTYCRRIGRLFTVSPDGYMQIWTPDENAPSLYAINFHGFGSNERTDNNIVSGQVTEDIGSVYTVTTIIGERVGGEIARDTTNQNSAKRAGTFRNGFALPFRHNVNATDPDIFERNTARKQAFWKYGRGIFDSWAYTVTVRGHHRDGNWWEADTFVTIHDSVNGIDGDFYISAVQYTRDERGDLTVLTIRKPRCLKASFGVFPAAPRYSAPTTTPIAGTESQTSVTTTKAR